ncbi:MAG: DUF4087 domain-containing protein [Methylococcaceae bacterium]|nr:DUF4087 domain-containing protein [Methylococcaceae bacterium]
MMKKCSFLNIRFINLILTVFYGSYALADATPELRCGWFENSSPGNASLTDKDGEWTIAVQGGYEAKGDWPTFKKLDWVSSGAGSYGYGCVCLKVTTNSESQEIVEIFKAIPKKLTDCRRDKALKTP